MTFKEKIMGVNFFAFGCYTATWLIVALENAGKEYASGVYSEWLPVKVLAVSILPVVCGYIAGKNSRD